MCVTNDIPLCYEYFKQRVWKLKGTEQDLMRKKLQSKQMTLKTELSKRSVRFTSKGLEFYLKTCQATRPLKCKQVKKCMDKMRDLMESNDNVNSVQAQLSKCIQCFEEASDMHEANLNLPEVKVEWQNRYFQAQRSVFSYFNEKVKGWLSDAGHPYVQSNGNDDEQPHDNLSVVSDEIKPEDSV